MSQTQRQKKRYSQFKKKHFDGKARGGPKEERRSEPGSHGRQAASEATAKQTSKRATHDSPRERKEGSPKYSTRTVASNWERYGDGSRAEEASSSRGSEEQLEQRLVQLLNLPPVPLPLPLPRPEEQLVSVRLKEKEEVAVAEAEEEGGGHFLTLDLPSLAESLSSLPTHLRLALSPAELQGSEEGEENTEEGDGSAETTHGADVQHSSRLMNSSISGSIYVDLKFLLGRAVNRGTFEFGVSGSVVGASRLEAGYAHIADGQGEGVAGVQVHLDETREDSVEDRELELLIHSTPSGRPPGRCEEKRHSVQGGEKGLWGGSEEGGRQEEEGGRGEPGPGGGRSRMESTEGDRREEGWKDNKPNTMELDDKPNTAELDDILDDLLA